MMVKVVTGEEYQHAFARVRTNGLLLHHRRNSRGDIPLAIACLMVVIVGG
jgi:hypothetical protein